MIPFLVIGCGNIGALYDIDNDKIQTHAKAIHNDPRFSLTVYDTNPDLMLRIAEKYQCNILSELNPHILKQFPCISICGPTNTHLHYILEGINSGAKIIICEKPISNFEKELELSKNAYSGSPTKIMVNYMRRFQPSYINLKKIIESIKQTDNIKNINIRYQKGFLNNCSHAFDLLEFLFDQQIEIEISSKINAIYDHFSTDPTVTFQGRWNDANIQVVGLIDIKYSFFEIDLFFDNYRIALLDSGNTIKVYKSQHGTNFHHALNLVKEYTVYDCLQNHMVYVIDYAFRILNSEVSEDNFLQSLELNRRMINYLEN